MTFKPNALAFGASVRGILPKPTSPSTWPSSRRSGTIGGTSQRPNCTSLFENVTLRASASKSAMAWSDTSRRQ